MQHAETMRGSASEPDLLLGRYRLQRRLGSGGFGTVWQARDERLERDVAVKRIPLDDTDPDRAQREAQAAARLSHPGIVALYETGADDEACYLVSELVRGATLRELLDEGALSDRDVVVIGAGLCEALGHAHSRGVIHRDVKPGNVMVCESHAGDAPVAKVCDFGIARIVGAEALTRTGDVVGTLAYMAPEQAEGRKITAAVDVYALGLVLYEALSGTNPVRGSGPADTARRVGMELPELSRLRRDLPEALCDVIDAAVSVQPRDRPSPAALRGGLLAAVDLVDDEPGVVEGPTISGLTQTWTQIQRRYRDPGETGWLRGLRDGLTRAGAADWEEAQDAPFAPEPPPEVLDDAPPALPRRLLQRGLAAATAAPLAALAVTHLGPGGDAAPVGGGLAAAATAALVFALPRLGWLIAAWAVELWLIAAGSSGTALVLACALLPVPLLLPLAGALWSIPAGGPVLGAIGLATAFPVIAGQAATVTRRAALGALGLLWVCIAELLTGQPLLAGIAGARGRPVWEDSLSQAVSGALEPLVTSGVLAVAPLWALAAVVLPWVVRGRSAALDLAGAAAWAAALAVGTQAMLDAVQPASTHGARGLALGAVIGAFGAVGLRAARRVARPAAPRLP